MHVFADGTGRATIVTPMGIGVEIKGQQLDKAFAGEQIEAAPEGHLWMIAAMFRVTHPERSHLEQQHLDAESLMMVTGVCCYRCEAIYTPGAELTPCTGVPA